MDKKQGLGFNSLRIIFPCSSWKCTFWFLLLILLILLNNFRNLLIFCIKVDIDKLLLLYKNKDLGGNSFRVISPLLFVGGWVVRRCHVSFVTWGVQLILAYSWARPAILVAGKGREVMFLFFLFLHFHSCFSFFPVPPFHLFCYLFCLFSPFLWETTQNDPQGLTCR